MVLPTAKMLINIVTYVNYYLVFTHTVQTYLLKYNILLVH